MRFVKLALLIVSVSSLNSFGDIRPFDPLIGKAFNVTDVVCTGTTATETQHEMDNNHSLGEQGNIITFEESGIPFEVNGQLVSQTRMNIESTGTITYIFGLDNNHRNDGSTSSNNVISYVKDPNDESMQWIETFNMVDLPSHPATHHVAYQSVLITQSVPGSFERISIERTLFNSYEGGFGLYICKADLELR